MLIANNHISITAEEKIKSICHPLFKTTEITFFTYVRSFNDGSLIVLPSSAKWHQYIVENNYHTLCYQSFHPRFHFWTAEIDLKEVLSNGRFLFNIDNIFEISEQGPQYYDRFLYASFPLNEKIIDFYLNNIEFLRKFQLYFKDKASDLIEACKNNKKHRLFINQFEKYNQRATEKNISQFQDFTHNRIRHYFLTSHLNGDVCLSHREMQCLLYTLKGKPARLISKLLNISDKTVASYLANAKRKLNCENKQELFLKAHQAGLFDLLKDW